jgi:hypothetical protein
MLLSYRCPDHRKGKGRVLVTERSTTARPVIDAFVLVSKGERHTLLCAKQPVRFRRNWFFVQLPGT